MIDRQTFLNSTTRDIERTIQKERYYYEYQIERSKQHWKLIFRSPLTVLALVFFLCYGIYFEWQLKVMIGEAFGYVVGGVLEYLVIKHIDKKGGKDT
jgi:hypothetical protein